MKTLVRGRPNLHASKTGKGHPRISMPCNQKLQLDIINVMAARKLNAPFQLLNQRNHSVQSTTEHNHFMASSQHSERRLVGFENY